MLLTVFCAAAITAQTRTVTGVVTSADDGEPLAGATVMPVGGNGQGTSTDLEGRFTLQVPTSITQLHVSYVGMVSKNVDITPGELKIALESSHNKLDEVMVVAYGTAKKSAFTGSAAVVGDAEIEKATVSNALNAINGKVAGVQMSNLSGAPGQTTPTIFIRGISSITADTQPLIVVNGTPFAGDVNTINPADIESMTVLKDAAANALYGARGANGVILITTKKGQMGAGATVTVDAKWGSNSRAMQLYNTINNPGEYYEMYYKYLYNYATLQGLAAPGAPANAWANSQLINSDRGLRYNIFSVPDGQFLIGTNGKLNPNATIGNKVTYRGQEYLLTPDDWMDASYKHSLRQEYNVSISNGTDRTQFYLSAGYLKNEGITPNSFYDRFTGRLSADTQAKSWLKVGADLSYTHYNAKALDEEGSRGSSVNLFAFATGMAPIYPIYVRDGEGNIMKNSDGILMYDYGNGMNAGLSRPNLGNANALGSTILDTNKYTGNSLSASGYLEIRFLKDFKLTINNAVDYNDAVYTYITNPYFGGYASSNGIIDKENEKTLNYTFQQLLNWQRTFNNVHEVSILAGHENYWQKYSLLYASKSNMFDPSNEELNGAITDGSMGSYTTNYNNEGWLFRGQYNYAEKYFGSVSYRRDASSRFAPDKRWGNFWSIGGAWIISKENFFHADWVDMLKIKASYGTQGNDRIGNFLYTNTYTLVNASGNPAASPSTMGNPNITWETNGNLNYGVEFDFFNSRLTGSIEGFYRKTSDMLFWFTLPPSFGWDGYYDNIGDMTNKGIEIELQGTLVQTRDIQWTINANLTWYKNNISYLPTEKKTLTVEDHGGYTNGNFFLGEGLPMYTYYLYKYAGVNPEDGTPLYYHRVTDANGINTGEIEKVGYSDLTSNDYFLCGSALPKVYGGFGTQFNCYGFDLSLDFTYSLGGQVLDTAYQTYMRSPSSNSIGGTMHKDLYNAWTPEHPYTLVPRLVYGDSNYNATSDRWLTSSNYLNLQNINFGYTLPQNVTKKMQLSKLRFYLSCENVCYWAKRKGLDPRQSITGTVNNTYYSPIRTISGGFNVTF